MKIFLLMIVCLQDPLLPLKDSCITVPMEEQFETVNECMYFSRELKAMNRDPNIYMSAFCTTKAVETI